MKEMAGANLHRARQENPSMLGVTGMDRSTILVVWSAAEQFVRENDARTALIFKVGAGDLKNCGSRR
jgi:hypothetical protein